MLVATNRFTLVPNHSGSATATLNDAHSQLALNVVGKSLEAQFCDSNAGYSLLVLTDDCPFEETLRLLLISPAGQVADDLAYAPALESLIVQQVEIVDETAVEIRCAGAANFHAAYRTNGISLVEKWQALWAGKVVGTNGQLLLSKQL